MKGFRIMALTEHGKAALQEQVKAREKQPFHARLMFSRIFSFFHDKESITLKIKNKGLAAVLQPEDVKEKIVQGFGEAGAEENKDFLVEVL